MKKMSIAILFAALAVLAVPAVQAQNATTWNLTGAAGYDVFYDFGAASGIWTHHMTFDTMDLKTGAFTGKGYFIPNKDYTWTVITGKVVGSNMTYHIDYTGLNAGYFVDHVGTVSTQEIFSGNCTTSLNQVPCKYYTKGKAPTGDTDGDGVTDDKDACSGTKAGAKVNPVGCSMEQLCPCVYWKNHGEYVSCIAHAKKEFVAAGILTEQEAAEIQKAAAQSDCGKK
jgi:hypothetical protein